MKVRWQNQHFTLFYSAVPDYMLIQPIYHITSLLVHRHVLFFPFSLPLRSGKQLSDLLLQITLQHGNWAPLPTRVSEPKWNLAGPTPLGPTSPGPISQAPRHGVRSEAFSNVTFFLGARG